MRVVSFGSINLDHVVEVEDDLADVAEQFDPVPGPGETVRAAEAPALDADRYNVGGKGSNQAVAAERAGADAAMLGAVGDDEAGETALARLRKRGVNVSEVQVVDEPTGRAYVLVGPGGENRIGILAGANNAVTSADAIDYAERVHHADVLLLQNEIPVPAMDALLDELEAAPERPQVVFDPAPPAGAEPLVTHEAVDYATPNEHEYESLPFDAFEGTVVQTRGADDILVEGFQEFAVTPPEVDVVDTTGAGDAFAGYFAARLAGGDTLRDAVEWAAAASALTTTREGTQTAVPTPEEVVELR